MQAIHIFHLAHASIHAFPAHACLISAHASLVFTDAFLMVPVHMMEWHNDGIYLLDFSMMEWHNDGIYLLDFNGLCK